MNMGVSKAGEDVVGSGEWWVVSKFFNGNDLSILHSYFSRIDFLGMNINEVAGDGKRIHKNKFGAAEFYKGKRNQCQRNKMRLPFMKAALKKIPVFILHHRTLYLLSHFSISTTIQC